MSGRQDHYWEQQRGRLRTRHHQADDAEPVQAGGNTGDVDLACPEPHIEAGDASADAHADVRQSSEESSVRRPLGVVLLGALCIAILTNGPSVFMAIRIAGDPLSFESTWFFLPFFGVAAIGLVGFARQWKEVLAVRFASAIIGFTIALLLISNLWSTAPTLSPQRSVITVGIILFGAVLGTLCTLSELSRIVFYGASIPILASAAVVALWPEIGLMGPDQFGFDQGFYQGIFANRNSLGPVAALVLVSTPPLLADLRSRRWPPLITQYSLVSIACAAWMAVGSRSTTPVVAVIIGVGVSGVVWIARRTLRGRISGATAATGAAGFAVLSVVLVFVNLERLMSLVGAEATLTNRRTIWRAVRSLIADRPLTGYGFWGVWNSSELPASALPPGYDSAHNSILEMAVGTGVVGGIAITVFLGASCVAAVRYMWLHGGLLAGWLAAMTVFLVVEHTTESFVLWYSYNLALVTAALYAGTRSMQRVADEDPPGRR